MKKLVLIALIVNLTSCYDMSKIRMEQYLNSNEHNLLIYDFLNEALSNEEVHYVVDSFCYDTAFGFNSGVISVINEFNDGLITNAKLIDEINSSDKANSNRWIVLSNPSSIKPLADEDSTFFDLQINKYKEYKWDFDLIKMKFKVISRYSDKHLKDSTEYKEEDNFPKTILFIPIFTKDRKTVFFFLGQYLGLLGGEEILYRFDLIDGRWSVTGHKLISIS